MTNIADNLKFLYFFSISKLKPVSQATEIKESNQPTNAQKVFSVYGARDGRSQEICQLGCPFAEKCSGIQEATAVHEGTTAATSVVQLEGLPTGPVRSPRLGCAAGVRAQEDESIWRLSARRGTWCIGNSLTMEGHLLLYNYIFYR